MTRIFFIALVAMLTLAQPARATHLRNVGSDLCMTQGATQAACGNFSSQDAAFDPVGDGWYHLRFGTQCVTTATGAPYETLTMTTCGSAIGQKWKFMEDPATPNSRALLSAVLSGTQGEGNCIGLGAAAPGSAGSALTTVYCIDEFREWSTRLEYVRGLNGSTPVPVLSIDSGKLGALISSVAPGTTCDCDSFNAGAFCAVGGGAALCRPTSSRTLESLGRITSGTWPVESTPNPATFAARVRAGQITASGRIDATNSLTIQNKKITCATPTDVGVYVPPGTTHVSILNSEITNCRYGVFAPGFGNDLLIQGNVFHGVATAIYAPASPGPVGNYKVSKNFAHTIDDRGEAYDGAFVQIADTAAGNGASEISCNVYHGRYVTGMNTAYHLYSIDKFNLGGSYPGTSSTPLKVRYNRALGAKTGGQDSGTMLQIGDSPSAPAGSFKWIDISYNTGVFMNGGTFVVSSGDHVILDHNRADSRGENAATKTGVSFNWSNYYGAGAQGCTSIGNCNGVCTNLTVTNNRGISRLWYFGSTGTDYGAANDGNCTPKTVTGNDFNDSTLTGEALFEEPYAECN